MSPRGDKPRNQLVELLRGRPGWNLEPSTTPGASPIWCFLVDGEIEFSVMADNGMIHLYIMATDQEFILKSGEELSAWIQTHRPEALQEIPDRPSVKERRKSFFEWN
jgi:hypothetical protein